MDVSKIPVFPPADVFPMMSDDELQELAADIKENGLREPIVVAEIPDSDGVFTSMLIDGRNRCAACSIAEIAPEVRQLNGEDPTAFVLSANIHRRHMTKGQRAMAVAKIYPEPEKGGRGKNSTVSVEFVSAQRISYARTVIAHAPALVDNVLSGAASLDEAYKTALDNKKDSVSDENQLVGLRERYPELADKVVEGELTLKAAKVEADERDARERSQRANVFSHLGKIVTVASAIPNEEFVLDYVQKLKEHPDEFQGQERYTVNDLTSACGALAEVLPLLKAALKGGVK